MNTPPLHWRALVQAALHRHRSEPTARYVQLATVDPQGHPRNRTVVFRGFAGDRIQFAFDARSEKIPQIQIHPQAEVCWYFPKTREQFRIAGTLKLLSGEDPDRQRLWEQISGSGKLLWFWPQPRAELAPVEAYLSQIVPDVPPPDTFVLGWLDPSQVDHLHLKGDLVYPQTRQIFIREGDIWLWQRVNP